ncbi:hypothetical protein [Algoriphagus boritolerans]|uniref:hypothetical protein n=1 Tax=Algoriphagus boritolerans TaxID=308111 RepID=UPI002FCE58A1
MVLLQMEIFFQYTLAEEDTLDNAAIYILNLTSGESKLVHEKMTTYSNVAFSPKSKYLSFIATADSLKSKKTGSYTLFVSDFIRVFFSSDRENYPGNPRWSRISPDGNVRFSEDESRMFFWRRRIM